jgi:hypothetical protein
MMKLFYKCGCKIGRVLSGDNAGMIGLYLSADELLSPGLTFETRRYRLSENGNWLYKSYELINAG